MRFDLLSQTLAEFGEIVAGDRERLSPECRTIACLPPVVVGLFQGAWDMTERAVAKDLGVSRDKVRKAWDSFEAQMILVGKEALAANLLTEDFVAELPPELVIGLPARVLLETIERARDMSTPSQGADGAEIVLASGLILTESRRPHGEFADKVWTELLRAKAALRRIQLDKKSRDCLCGVLLAGGAETSDLPPGLQGMVASFEQLPKHMRDSCDAVRHPLTAVAIECSRQELFRVKLENVIQALIADEEACASEAASGSDDESAAFSSDLHAP
eukprot:gnl/TRDRNA2_/TRDRNA2_126250_c0_seq1.p1 gnl/TRDRNA2_/TRDRNA2_126250_c0~~gnl/TRDRNA2_/TRDRNA2_126250_c0_seq1.p1  ORF type:complete len:274 (+),score=61.29 gnl/TRDRNA2_/TRDRNA2_126250_c0_seq1:691-1512(+)